ncbi:MAG: 2-polyprenyl-3-methyl-5-hydroxy-6-metoxy-1 [Candidatus Alkanophagales archaeon MCA70_species_2]|nr:2-polyprenyl-3-methyl-5-hydroxy-6-metoxy-1 [Candidatus Alkanophaga liquidiphilum]
MDVVKLHAWGERNRQKEYYEDYWERGGVIQGPQLEDKRAFIMEHVGRGKKVLDVGCGDGYVSSILVGDNEVFGLDIAESAIEEARRRGIKAVVSNLESIPFPDKSFDVILALDILEHLFDPIRVLREAGRVLKDDGILLVSVPNAANIYSRIIFLLTGELMDAAEISERRTPEFLFSEHIRFFSANKIRKVLQLTGFKTTTFRPYLQPYFVNPPYTRFNWLLRVVHLLKLPKVFPSLFSTWFLLCAKKYS